MRRHIGSGILILVILLSVGFATVATNLLLNGQANISSNSNDFDIYFTNASTETGGTAVIDTADKKHISFVSKKLSFVGNETYLDYTVYNNSSQYDANVNVEFTAENTVDGVDYSEYYSITFTGFDPTTSDHTTALSAKSSHNGRITIRLVKALLQEVEIEFTLTLVPSAVERTEEGVYTPNYQIISGDLDTVGSVVKIADEEFYVIGQEDDQHVKLFAKYNLNVGENLQPGTEGLQNPLSIGWNSDESTKVNNVYPGAVPFNTNGQYYLDSENSKIYDEYGGYVFKNNQYYDNDDNLVYPYIYTNKYTDGDYVANIARYVENYVGYLNSQGVITSGRLLTYEEMSELGCNGSGSACVGEDWVSNTSYYTGNLRAIDLMWVVSSSHQYGDNGYAARYSLMLGVRPVILLQK